MTHFIVTSEYEDADGNTRYKPFARQWEGHSFYSLKEAEDFAKDNIKAWSKKSRNYERITIFAAIAEFETTSIHGKTLAEIMESVE